MQQMVSKIINCRSPLSNNSLIDEETQDVYYVSGSSPKTQEKGLMKGRSSMNDFYLIDRQTEERIYPNEMLHRIDNDLMVGYMLVMISTNDVEIEHFVGKKRKIEMQFQVKFKKKPEKQLYVGCELMKPLKLGVCQRVFLKTILNGVERKNPDFHYNLNFSNTEGDRSHSSNATDNFERSDNPHMSMPLESSLNAFVATKEGELPPTLGRMLKRTHLKSGDIDFNCSDTYTFSIYSGYPDLVNWRCNGIGRAPPFSLNSIIGTQTFNLSFFSIEGKRSNNSRYGVNSFMEFEFGHAMSKIGPSCKAWLRNRALAKTELELDEIRDEVSSHDIITDLESSMHLDGGCMCWTPWSNSTC